MDRSHEKTGDPEPVKTIDNNPKKTRLGVFLLVLVPVFAFLVLSGDFWFRWMSNDKCYRFLGCNAGFFGYDAMVHFLSGLLIMTALLWINHWYPKALPLGERPRERFLLLMGIVALIGIGWEMIEFVFDHFRMDVLHMNLVWPNVMAQASNADTMGDMTFGLLGAFLMFCAYEAKRRFWTRLT